MNVAAAAAAEALSAAKMVAIATEPQARELAKAAPGDRDSFVQTLVDSTVSMTAAIKWHLLD
jgi:hypothetical protein